MTSLFSAIHDDPAIEVDAACLDVVERLTTSDPAAVGLVYERYVRQLVSGASKLIPDRHLGKIEPESVVHSVMQGLLDMSPEAKERLTKYQIRTWPQLYGLLARITMRKALNRVRKFDTQGRASAREEQADPLALTAAGPAPEDAAAFAELLEQMWDHFTDAEREVIRLSMEGYAVPEIADRVKFTATRVKSVRRKLSRWLDRRGLPGGEAAA